MENSAAQEYMDNFLSQITISYRKINIEGSSDLETGCIKGDDMEKLSNILFPFDALYCQYIFFVSFDEPRDYNKNNRDMLLYCCYKCWKYAASKRKDFLMQLKSSTITAEHFTFENTRDITKQIVDEKKDLMHSLIDYISSKLTDASFYGWEQHEIIMGERGEQLLYGSCKLVDGSMDLAIPFIISYNLIEGFKIYYPFHVETSSITILKILESPFPIKGDIEKIEYNSEKSNIVNDKVVIFKDKKTEEIIQANNATDISRIEPEYENYEK